MNLYTAEQIWAAFGRPEPPPKSEHTYQAPRSNAEPYGKRALEDECAFVARATVGERNRTLNRAAFNLGQLVGGGCLDEAEVRNALLAAARALVDEDGERSVLATIDSGLRAGRVFPRRPPERERTGGGKANGAPEADAADGAAIQPLRIVYLDEKPPTPTRWLVRGVLAEGACAVIGAEPKTGKTWVALEVAVCLALGEPVFTWPVERPGGRTLVFCPEGGQDNLRRRLWALCWGRAHRANPAGVLRHIPVIAERVNLNDDASYARMLATVHHVQPDLLVIDPLISAHQGADEDKAGDMQPVLNRIRDLVSVAKPDMAILCTHHTSKGAAGNRSTMYGLRGSSAIGAWLDTLIDLRREEDSPTAPRRLSVWHRDAASPDPLRYHLDVTDRGDGLVNVCLVKDEHRRHA